jgi:hypothetical protein
MARQGVFTRCFVDIRSPLSTRMNNKTELPPTHNILRYQNQEQSTSATHGFNSITHEGSNSLSSEKKLF